MSGPVELEDERVRRYRDKLDMLDERLGYLDKWIAEDDLEDVKNRFAVFKAFQESAEVVADVCSMYLSDKDKGLGDDRENIVKASGNLYQRDLEKELGEVNGLRNRITHDYGDGFDTRLAAESLIELMESLERGEKMDRKKVEEDFSFLKNDDDVLAVLLFGSQVTGDTNERSDIDICVVAPEVEPIKMMRKVWRNLKTEKYDVHTFEELSLKMKHQVIEDYEVVYVIDRRELKEYLHRYRQVWNDQAVARGVS